MTVSDLLKAIQENNEGPNAEITFRHYNRKLGLIETMNLDFIDNNTSNDGNGFIIDFDVSPLHQKSLSTFIKEYIDKYKETNTVSGETKQTECELLEKFGAKIEEFLKENSAKYIDDLSLNYINYRSNFKDYSLERAVFKYITKSGREKVIRGYYTSQRVQHFPDMYKYEMRHLDNDNSELGEISDKPVLVNFFGTFITNMKLDEEILNRDISHEEYNKVLLGDCIMYDSCLTTLETEDDYEDADVEYYKTGYWLV